MALVLTMEGFSVTYLGIDVGQFVRKVLAGRPSGHAVAS
jgi:hypothetical protein